MTALQTQLPGDWEAFDRLDAVDVAAGDWFNEDANGSGFEYERTPLVFGGRQGRGPLIIAWDTNLLIDYLTFGRDMWEDGPALPPGEYGDEIAAVDALMTGVFVWRDIVMWLPPSQVLDSKKVMSEEARQIRSQARSVMLEAGMMVLGDRSLKDPHESRVERLLAVLEFLPAGFDRILVAEAVTADCHVFLTRDDGLLKNANKLRSVIALMRPTQLLDTLAWAGELLPATWSVAGEPLMPDLQRLSCLIEVAELGRDSSHSLLERDLGRSE